MALKLKSVVAVMIFAVFIVGILLTAITVQEQLEQKVIISFTVPTQILLVGVNAPLGLIWWLLENATKTQPNTESRKQ